MYYILVYALTGVQDSKAIPLKDAIYQLKAVMHPQDLRLPYEKIFPGNDGLLEYGETDDELNIRFAGVEFHRKLNDDLNDKGIANDLLKIKYDTYFSQNYHAVDSLLKCNFNPKGDGEFKGYNGKFEYF